jgi:hypothetical protein
MMCRVVVNKLLPLNEYAPADPLSPGEPSHNVQAILPNILPEPFVYENHRQFLETVNEGSIRTGISSLFNVDLSSSAKDGLSMQSGTVKRYTLNNPKKIFEKLMENEDYARDVRDLLKDTSFGRAYLVVGFLTTTGTIWTQTESRSVSAGLKLMLPAQVVGSPLPGVANPELHPSVSTTQRRGRHMHVVEEEIFAIAYDEVKTSYSIDLPAGKLKKTLVLGSSVRSQGKSFAFTPESDSDDSSDEDDDSSAMEVVLVDEDDEDDDFMARSNHFDCEVED